MYDRRFRISPVTMISFIQRTSSGKNVLLFLIPAMLVYLLMILYTIPAVEKYAPGMKLFDLSPGGYSLEYANQLLTKLGETGRALYLYRQIPLDFLYPGLFAISCSLLLSWLLLKSKHPDSKLFYFCFLPLLAGLFDYIENVLVIRLITSYPEISPEQVTLSSFATITKSVLTTLFFVVLLFSAISYWLYTARNANNANKPPGT